jgi:hypothetical protein
MAAVTQGNNMYSQQGNKVVVTTTFTNPADTNTWATGLAVIDHVSLQITEAADAADSLGCTISGGTVTLTVAGTITAARARAEGV